MPYVAGISFNSLAPGSKVAVQLLSSDDNNYAHTFEASVDSDLKSTFQSIANALPEKCEQFTLSLPSNIRDAERKAILRAAHTVRIFRYIGYSENIQIVQNELKVDPTPLRNELVLEITPDVAISRLVSTEVEEGIRSSDLAKEIVIENPENADLLAELVEPALETLKTTPTDAGSELKRVVIVGVSPLISPLADKITSKLEGVEVITASDLAKYTAKKALSSYHDSMAEKLVFNVVPLRVGIVKADGYVVTALAQNATLPQEKSVLLTTSEDNQTSATINIVVGTSPVAKDNTSIAKINLSGLKSRAKGATTIKVSFSVELEGKTIIVAEEVEDGSPVGARASVELGDVIGDLIWDDVEDILAATNPTFDEVAVTEAEDLWAGEDAQGDLPV
ncbi:Chaperone protein DnaK [Psilocybe cubensis]|uniref:Chaperone protein DnaK n=2 Tax=Psilocybe cubensis TaxID=181762 RepID=A0ACB8GZ23_PSICU|nr:Chaperone protein DnaK [Psilocybe cubensis]KAH9480876.1 Chaperone protein DnaK [Psilocybe cubensis]